MRAQSPFALLVALLVGLPAVPAVAAQAQASPCQWVCSGDTCRSNTSAGGSCDNGSVTTQVASDPQEPTCQDGDLLTDTTSTPFVTGAAATFSSTTTSPTGPTTSPTSPTSPTTPPATPPPTQVLLTGFCPWGSVSDNPSQRILDSALEAAIQKQCGPNLSLTMVCLMVDQQAIRSCSTSNRIVISLGVDVGATGFRLEQSAINQFTDGNPVCLGGPESVVGSAPRPTLPGNIGGYPIQDGPIVPNPDNNFVCNATYYWLCTQSTCTPYFLHVPDFQPSEDAGVVPGLAQLICNIINANKTAPVQKLGRTMTLGSGR